MENTSIIDRWINHLREENSLSDEDRKVLIDELNRDIRDQKKLQKMILAEAEHLPYEHLQEAARKLARDKEEVIDILSGIVKGLGSKVDAEVIDDFSATASGNFAAILELENELGERIAEHANLAEDCGLYEQAEQLLQLKDLHYNHQERIEELIMKTNATL
ncbi:MAG: hypothetical protein D6748_14905 [Calditrichaeota bacterium]|nr:MAG: hypothetical protein D6748_14905 [Calditrichota bacterium]